MLDIVPKEVIRDEINALKNVLSARLNCRLNVFGGERLQNAQKALSVRTGA